MVKVKTVTNKLENVSKIKTKSLSVHRSIKSEKSRRKSMATSVSTPSKPKKGKEGRNSHNFGFEVSNIDEGDPLIAKSKFQKMETPTPKKAVGGDNVNKADNSTSLKEKYNINIEDVENAIKGVINLQSQNAKIKNQLFSDESFKINLIINCFKIPVGRQTILRIPLKYTLLAPDDEICLFVSEVKGVGNKEHEKHVEYYEDLLSKKGITNIKKIMTVHELRTEYETFEQKARLVDLYDAFLVCGKVSGKVVRKCGRIFYKKRKIPTPVKLYVTQLKKHVDTQLSKAFLHLKVRGDSCHVDFGHSKMEVSDIVENFVSVVEFLEKNYPGGFENIKGLHVIAPRSSAIPVYISTKNPTDIPTPKVKYPNRKYKLKAVTDELTTLPGAQVYVKPDGRVLVTRIKTEADEDNITLKDIEDDIKNVKNNKNDTKEIKEKAKNKKSKQSKESKNKSKKIKTSNKLLPDVEDNVKNGESNENGAGQEVENKKRAISMHISKEPKKQMRKMKGNNNKINKIKKERKK